MTKLKVFISFWHKLVPSEYNLFFFFFFFFVFCLFVVVIVVVAISWAAPAAYGGSQARGLIGAVAAGLCHSHSNARSLTHWARPGIEPATSWFLVGFVNHCATMGTPFFFSLIFIYLFILFIFIFPTLFFFFFFVFLSFLLLLLLLFLGPLPRHMEVPRLGVESEL